MSLITNRFHNLTITLALLILSAFTISTASAGVDPYKLEPIATVDGIKITRMELDSAVTTLLPYASLHKSVSEKRYEQTRQKALDQLIDVELIYKDAKRKNQHKAPKAEIDSKIESLKGKLPKGETLKKVLKASDMTMAQLREDLNKTLVIRAQKEAMKKAHLEKAAKTVDTAYMKEYYKDNLHKFKEPKRIRLNNILLKSDPSGGPKVWNETRERALEILKEARSGTEFSELAKKHSQGPNAANGGDMGWAHEGSLLEEIDHAASALKKGEISEPVMTIYGYHLVQLVDSTPTKQKKFENLNHKNLKEQLEKREYDRNNKEWLKELRKDAKIEILVKDLY